MTEAVHWDDEGELLGVQVRVRFFEPNAFAGQTVPLNRLLPELGDAALRPLAPVGQRTTYRVAGLQAQPEQVLAHGNGLLCVANRPVDGRRHEADQWRRELPVVAMLQAVATAMAVAGELQLPTVALWRGPNALYQFDPGPQVLECLATHIGQACDYWGEPEAVAPAQLATFCEPRLRALPGLAHDGGVALA